MYIEGIFRFINFLKSQNQGRGISAKEFEDLFNQASLSLWRREIHRYGKSKLSLAYLKNFETEETLSVDTEIPDELGQIDSFEVGVLSGANSLLSSSNVDWLDEHQFSLRKHDDLYPPDEEQPILRTLGRSVVVIPESFTGYKVTGLKYPKKIVYGTTASNDGRDYIFDENTSIDTDWPELAHGELIAMISQKLGINLKEDWLVQYENLQKQSEVIYDKSEQDK